MKRLVLILAGLALAACTSTRYPEPAEDGSPAWLEGLWRAEQEGSVIEEHWSDYQGGGMIGTSRRFEGGRMVEFEFLRIEAREGVHYYIALPGGTKGTVFAEIESGQGLLVFENKNHDFPQRITYRLVDGDSLEAAIEGTLGGEFRRMEFHFHRPD